MHLMCERISSVFAGIIVGLWFAKTFPSETDDAKNKGKDKKK